MNEDGSTLKRIMYTSPHAKQKDICPLFQNQIAKLTNLLHYGDFCVCGRKSTDNEYNHMINTEVENAENRVSGIFKGLEVDRYCCKQLSDFLEQFLGIELLAWQKKLLDMQYKETVFVQSKNPGKEFSIYLKLLLAYMYMKEEDTIGIVNYPDDVKILSKDEFGKWLREKYC